MIRTDLPDGTFIKVAFTPWQQVAHDANDNVLASDWYAERDALVGGTPHNDGEKYAALHAEPHDGTPTTTLLDNLGRPFLVIADNGLVEAVPQKFETRTKLDIEGNTLEVKDARNNIAETNTFAPGGLQLKTHSVDAGTRLAVPDALGNPLRAWDNRQNVRRWTYDVLSRPTHAYLKHAADPEVLQQRVVYGESLGVGADVTNHLGQVYRVYDSAGVLTSVAYDFKGNLLATERRLAEDYETTPDWIDLATETDPALIHAAAAPLLEAETFTTSWTYDALNRVLTQTTPDASVTTQTFGLGGMLQSVAVNVRGALAATNIVTNIDYNARGQRLLIAYGNGSTTDYAYDPRNFRVTRIHTERPHTDPDLRTVQDLRYHYDPSGNIAQIRDQAQQGVFFDNDYVDPTQKFVYDPTYRLVEATGREHDSLPMPTAEGFAPIAHPQDTQAQRNYTQRYTYDPVGNITQMAHHVVVDDVEEIVWRRGYLYASGGNRLLRTSLPADNFNDPPNYSVQYQHDAHGNMTAMPTIPGGLTWDDDDRLQSSDAIGGGTTYYVYDGSGQRVRKVTVNQSGTTSKQRLYFGSWETYREHKNINTTNDLDLERETLHVHDDHGRVCLIETKTVDSGAPVVTPANIARYQYSNHLGTANLELDDDAEVISYEEFHPYGTSSYRAANSAIEVSAKRYRYTGQERDEETGLAYHSARYYAPWLARWTAADRIGLAGGINLYAYVSGNPIIHNDPSGLRPPFGEPWETDLEDAKTAVLDALQPLPTAVSEVRELADETRESAKETVSAVAAEGPGIAYDMTLGWVTNPRKSTDTLLGLTHAVVDPLVRMAMNPSTVITDQTDPVMNDIEQRKYFKAAARVALAAVGAVIERYVDFGALGKSHKKHQPHGTHPSSAKNLSRNQTEETTSPPKKQTHETDESTTSEGAAASSPAAPTPDWFNRLPPKIQKQILKAQLPVTGATPFRPKIVKKHGELQIPSAEVHYGRRAGESGRVDTEGRVWLRDIPHAGYPSHWDVQIDDGRRHENVGFDGNPIRKINEQ